MAKNDAKKQREFFEKRKMQQKRKDLGLHLCGPLQGSGSMDLVTLFVVNQIAAKKENKDPPKFAVLGGCKGRRRNEPLVLPMSPCSPSRLSLVESQPQSSVQEARQRKSIIPQAFKCRQLSPVLESAFSDNSASDYLPPAAEPLSPFSSSSSASSRPGAVVNDLSQQQRGPSPSRCSPLPWDTAGPDQATFQPFSQPRGMTDGIPWSCGSNPPFYQLEAPSAARVLFGSPESDETRGLAFPLNQEPMLDFSLHQAESQLHFEEGVFIGFSNEEYEIEASQFGSEQSKIYLQDGTPVKPSTPQTVPDPQCMELSNCTDISCPEHSTSTCECSSDYSCGGDDVSSDSDDEGGCCQPVDRACCADSVNQTLSSQGKHSLQIPSTPHTQEIPSQYQKATEKDQSLQSNHTPSPGLLDQSQSSGICKCKKTANETQDAGTQTPDISPETCDAATQCSLLSESVSKDPGPSFRPPRVSLPHPATGRQTSYTDAHTASSAQKKLRITYPSSVLNRPTNDRGWEHGGNRGQREPGPQVKDLSNVSPATRVHGLSEEGETLQEIANILLLLRQRKKEG
ncbi:uncharacterized protein redic1 [Aulostomus maculatus]